MRQKLIFPINATKLIASWKSEAYERHFGHAHYGADMICTTDDRSLYASGEGVVLVAGKDNIAGYTLVVLYPSAENHVTGNTENLVLRYMNLSRIVVKVGTKVKTGDTLGLLSGGVGDRDVPYLHLEADTDTAHPLHTPTARTSDLLKGKSFGATDSSMQNPMEWLYCHTADPHRQTFSVASDSYIRPEDETPAYIS